GGARRHQRDREDRFHPAGAASGGRLRPRVSRGARGGAVLSAREGATFLLEIGTEEIPARLITAALAELGTAILPALPGARPWPGDVGGSGVPAETFGTPRRLAVRLRGLPARQPDVEREVTGPKASAAFDAAGRPTKAAEGFARAQGVPLESLRRIVTPKGE